MRPQANNEVLFSETRLDDNDGNPGYTHTSVTLVLWSREKRDDHVPTECYQLYAYHSKYDPDNNMNHKRRWTGDVHYRTDKPTAIRLAIKLFDYLHAGGSIDSWTDNPFEFHQKGLVRLWEDSHESRD